MKIILVTINVIYHFSHLQCKIMDTTATYINIEYNYVV